MLSVSDSYYIRMIVYVLRVAHGERGAVHSFFELLRVSYILSGLEEHCVPCCGGSRNEAVHFFFGQLLHGPEQRSTETQWSG